MSYLLVLFTHYMLPVHLRAKAVLTVIGHGSGHLRSEVWTGLHSLTSASSSRADRQYCSV